MEISFTEENIAKLFGQEAAEDEEFFRLQAYYLKNKTHEKLVANLPLRILVGHKGTGKSAIFAIARHEDIDNNRISLLIRPDDISDIGIENTDFSQMVREWKKGLLSIVSKKVYENLGLFLKDEDFKKTANYSGKIINIVKDIFNKKIDIDTKDVDKQVISQFLKDNRIIVYIDDLDRGWESKKEDIQRISALLNAVRDLCNDNNGLQFRISLRTDVYFLVRTSDESTDKIEGSVIWHSWTNHEILLLLIKRIAIFLGNKDIDIEKLRNVKQANLSHYLDDIFEEKFKAYGKWENAPTYKILMSLTRKRPRDLVKLCTLAAKDAYDKDFNKIRTENLQSIFSEYSQGRIQDTINEYKSELPDIDRLLLNMKPSRKEVRDHQGYIYDTNKLKQKIKSIREHGKFYFRNKREASTEDLLQFMYKINFITARKNLQDGTIERKYFEENKYLSSKFVNFGYDWEVHPAFRWALSPDSINTILSKMDVYNDDLD